MNRRRDGGVHEVMNRPDMYLKQIHGLQAWLHAHSDEEGAAQAGDLAEHLSRNHEAVDDQTTPTWAEGADDEVDVEPDIRCSPEPGCIFENHAGERRLRSDRPIASAVFFLLNRAMRKAGGFNPKNGDELLDFVCLAIDDAVVATVAHRELARRLQQAELKVRSLEAQGLLALGGSSASDVGEP